MLSPFRGKIAAIGVGETPYYPHGKSPEDAQTLTLRAITAACEDAGIAPAEIDGFASYADDTNPGHTLVRALGTKEMRWSSMVWGGGGGGTAGALGAAAAAIFSGQAEIVAVYRTICESHHGRLSDAVTHYGMGPHYTHNHITSAAQICGLRTNRLIAAGLPRAALRNLVLAQYHHAARNPRAKTFGKPLTAEAYDASRLIAEPFRLYDCSRENDISVAILLTSAARANALRQKPVHLLASAQGGITGESWENDADYAGGGFTQIAQRLWQQSGYGPADINVAQIYDNFSGPALAAMLDHGLFTLESAAETLTFENLIADGGRLPINTSSGLIAEGNAHGMGLVAEAIRQLRGDSPNPVKNAHLCLVTGGANTPCSSSALFGTAETL